MIAIDTNILVRIVNNDDPDQALRARRLLTGNDVFVPKTVLIESEWVLRACYDLGRETIVHALRSFLSLPKITAEDAEAVWQALGDYESGLDFADALHLASSAEAQRFATFDKVLRKLAGRRKSPPVVVEP